MHLPDQLNPEKSTFWSVQRPNLTHKKARVELRTGCFASPARLALSLSQKTFIRSTNSPTFTPSLAMSLIDAERKIPNSLAQRARHAV